MRPPLRCLVRPHLVCRLLVLVAVLGGLAPASLVPAAQAQVTITEADIRALVGQRLFVQEFTATNPAAAQDVVAETGPDGTYDLRDLTFELTGFGVTTDLDAAGTAVPGQGEYPDANVVTRASLRQPDGTSGPPIFLFQAVDATSVEFLGTASEQDDGSGGTTVFVIKNDPPRLQAPLPLTYTDPLTTWTTTSTRFVGTAGGPLTPVGTETNDYAVTGFGRLRLPVGEVDDVLRVRRDVTGGGNAFTQLDIASPDGRLAATVELDATGTVTEVTYRVVADEGAQAPVAVGATGTVPSVGGLTVELTGASTSAGTLSTFRYDREVPNETFSGGAAQTSGGAVTPDRVAEGYYVVEGEGLTGFTAEVCLETSGLDGVSDLGTLVVGTRPDAASPITPLDTTVDGTQVCATVTSFSEFFVTAGPSNPLPVELTAFTARPDGPAAVALAWATASETASAGFAVEHAAPGAAPGAVPGAAPGASGFTEIGFVEGAGTTTEARRYAFRADGLAPGTHRFRLRQVDLDGTATRSAPVAVEVAPAARLVVTAPYPNPARARTTLTVTVPTTQRVTAAVYDVLGRRVAVLHDGPLAGPDAHRLTLETAGLPSGVYLVRVTTPNAATTRRVTVVR